MYSLVNISNHPVVLVKELPNKKLEYQKIDPGESISISELTDYINLANLIDPRLGIFKISITN